MTDETPLLFEIGFPGGLKDPVVDRLVVAVGVAVLVLVKLAPPEVLELELELARSRDTKRKAGEEPFQCLNDVIGVANHGAPVVPVGTIHLVEGDGC